MNVEGDISMSEGNGVSPKENPPAEVIERMNDASEIPPAPGPKTNVIAWKFPRGINPSNYWWNIQSAPGMSGPWVTVITNASGDNTVFVSRTNAMGFWRLVGRQTR